MTEPSNGYPLFMRRTVQTYAVIGGLCLMTAALVTVFSVISRGLGLNAITGDFELVELATGIAVFSFLPWGHMTNDHVRVDVIAERFGPKVFKYLGILSDALVALVSVVILWRLYLGFAEKLPFGSEAFRDAFSMGRKPFYPETTYELQIPMWFPYGFCLVGAGLFVVVAVTKVALDFKRKIA